MPSDNQFLLAIHMMVALAGAGDNGLSSGRLAEGMDLSSSFLRRTLLKLIKSGLVRSGRGRYGAYRLAKHAEEISFLEIYRAIGVDPGRRFSMQVRYPSLAIAPALDVVCKRADAAWDLDLGRTRLAEFIKNLPDG
jgi:Rrf2 family protein